MIKQSSLPKTPYNQSVNVINQLISLALPMHLKSFVGEDYGLY